MEPVHAEPYITVGQVTRTDTLGIDLTLDCTEARERERDREREWENGKGTARILRVGKTNERNELYCMVINCLMEVQSFNGEGRLCEYRMSLLSCAEMCCKSLCQCLRWLLLNTRAFSSSPARYCCFIYLPPLWQHSHENK